MVTHFFGDITRLFSGGYTFFTLVTQEVTQREELCNHLCNHINGVRTPKIGSGYTVTQVTQFFTRILGKKNTRAREVILATRALLCFFPVEEHLFLCNCVTYI